ncbi:putative Zinc finger, RING-CH-type, Zinc finger, RING/FYVE/PHD-type [Helianthus annuus]|nr:putative Zinc finger, RING-CH-type, Zinc finger, RING/FYVE/PHD-type [Helianthus annuus]
MDFPNDVVQPPRPSPPPTRRRRRRNRRPPTRRNRRPPHSTTTTDGDGSFGLSDSDAPSSSSARVDSECGSSGIFSYNPSRIESSSDEIDLESGELEMKVHCLVKNEKLCRICHLNFEICGGDTAEDDGGGGGEIELGCKCKGDLGAAHKQCAETWFKIKGNMTCEICGAIAQNVGGEQNNETSHTTAETEPTAAGPMVVPTEPARTFWRGRRIMNILLGCMVFAFIISWLFHFNVLP